MGPNYILRSGEELFAWVKTESAAFVSALWALNESAAFFGTIWALSIQSVPNTAVDLEILFW